MIRKFWGRFISTEPWHYPSEVKTFYITDLPKEEQNHYKRMFEALEKERNDRQRFGDMKNTVNNLMKLEC